jgi:hypothetical protein
MSYTYWVYDESVVNIHEWPPRPPRGELPRIERPNRDHASRRHGYVGVSEDPISRWRALKTEGRVPKHAKLAVLFEGTREQCRRWERRLRPRPNIGWNKSVGGVAPDPWKRGYAPIGLAWA